MGPTQLLIESQGPTEGGRNRFLRTAGQLAATGTPTLLFLTDDGVLSALADGAEHATDLAQAMRAGVSVLADQAALTERDITAADLAPGVAPADLDKITSMLFAPDVKVVWH